MLLQKTDSFASVPVLHEPSRVGHIETIVILLQVEGIRLLEVKSESMLLTQHFGHLDHRGVVIDRGDVVTVG